jgi:Zn-dependent protease with chaperone function
MNFFERQAETRRSSRRLVVLFLLAVVAVVAAVDLVAFFLFSSMQERASGDPVLRMGEWMSAHPGAVLVTTATVLAVIGLSSLYKTTVLGGGGGVVARSLGGVRVSADTTDPLQRRLLNVVEEMAIASGVPMPEVYLLEQEAGINAFAAGHNASNAAIGVTRGALTTLNRAELQGVIAHEFSHILNGDMRLNIRLMGLLFGLLVIAVIGRTILRGASRVRGDKKGGAAIVLGLAFALFLIGYVGLFFGRLIQAAVSRNRESLADASAVQFTRDPLGLRGALVKIGAVAAGSRIANTGVEEAAHMMFAPGLSRFFSTHPPLMERLRAIDPRFQESEFADMRSRLVATQAASAAEEKGGREAGERRSLDDLIVLPTDAAKAVVGLVGNPGTAHMQVAREIRRSLPEAIVTAGRHPETARAVLLALALDRNAEARERQKRFVAQQLGEAVSRMVSALETHVDGLEAEQRMPALLRAFPALRQLTRDERLQLMSCLNGMLQREGAVSLGAYVLRRLAQVHLRDDLDPVARVDRLTLNVVQADVQVLFSVLAHLGHADEPSARRAYEAGTHHLFPRDRPAYAPMPNWAAQLDRALIRLDRVAPAGKEQLVEAMVKTAIHDQRVTVGEAELLRAICATLHCPLPPLVQ